MLKIDDLIIYEDNHLLILNKPCGIAVQNDSSKENLYDIVKIFLMKKYNKNNPAWLGIVHRLDQSVSGVLIFAKNSKSASRLCNQFNSKSIEKNYIAIVSGEVNDSKLLENFLVKSDRMSKIVSAKTNNSKSAKLEYSSIHGSKKFSILKINLITGYYHQIRCQLAGIRHPVLGDTKYGSDIKTPRGQIFLHCRSIKFLHPVTKKEIFISADFSKEWKDFISKNKLTVE
ncbi:MAG: hypothetical protein ACD_79C01047G0006 [uncultured bacterium]|nr:MAG: hypothetical protein ACD_79C01047G0006 [uncultured bacterium]